MLATLAAVDLVGASAIARPESLLPNPNDANGPAGPVEHFVREALRTSGLGGATIQSDTGDGAVLQFAAPKDAERFATALFAAAAAHNAAVRRKEDERAFRVGVATGEAQAPALHRAAQLRGAARGGEVLIDRETYEKLPEEIRQLCGPEELVSGRGPSAVSARRMPVSRRLPPEVRDEVIRSLPPPEERARMYRELQEGGGLSIDELLAPAAPESAPRP